MRLYSILMLPRIVQYCTFCIYRHIIYCIHIYLRYFVDIYRHLEKQHLLGIFCNVAHHCQVMCGLLIRRASRYYVLNSGLEFLIRRFILRVSWAEVVNIMLMLGLISSIAFAIYTAPFGRVDFSKNGRTIERGGMEVAEASVTLSHD